MSELEAALLGGVIGGALGVLSALLASYFGPRWLEQWRADQKETREYGPRKELLKQMLMEPNPAIRSFDRLQLVSGTNEDECRRLLIEIGARGVLMRRGREGWALIDRYGFNEPAELDVDPDEA